MIKLKNNSKLTEAEQYLLEVLNKKKAQHAA